MSAPDLDEGFDTESGRTYSDPTPPPAADLDALEGRMRQCAADLSCNADAFGGMTVKLSDPFARKTANTLRDAAAALSSLRAELAQARQIEVEAAAVLRSICDTQGAGHVFALERARAWLAGGHDA